MQKRQKTTSKKTKIDEGGFHHAGDKSFKVVMKIKDSALEYIEQFFPELYNLIDPYQFELDNTNYIAKGFDEFFSDVVYRTELKAIIDKRKKKVAIALLFEHKKTIKSYFHLFLQLLEYIILIWKEDLANKKKPSIIVPIVFFQGKKGLQAKELHNCFKDAPNELLPFIPNFKCHLTNVHDLANEKIIALKEDGLLRGLFLAYIYKERKSEIKDILIEIFKFFKFDPNKFDFFSLIFDFLAQEDYLSADDLNELMSQFTSPKIRENIMTSAQVWKAEGKIEGKIEGLRLAVLRGRFYGASAEFLANISELPHSEVNDLLKGYDSVFDAYSKNQKIDKIEFLSSTEIEYLVNLFNVKKN